MARKTKKFDTMEQTINENTRTTKWSSQNAASPDFFSSTDLNFEINEGGEEREKGM